MTKALISSTVTAKLIFAFVFAYVDFWFSHAVAHFRYAVGTLWLGLVWFQGSWILVVHALCFKYKQSLYFLSLRNEFQFSGVQGGVHVSFACDPQWFIAALPSE